MCHNRPSAGLVRLPSFQLIRVDSSARANVAIRKQNPLGKNETLVLYHTGILTQSSLLLHFSSRSRSTDSASVGVALIRFELIDGRSTLKHFLKSRLPVTDQLRALLCCEADAGFSVGL